MSLLFRHTKIIQLKVAEHFLRSSFSRTRRPDRAVYVPRAKRSQTTPPASSHINKCNKTKSKSIDENQSNIEVFPNDKNLESVLVSNTLENCERQTGCEFISKKETESFKLGEKNLINGKNVKNSNSLTMTDQAKVLTIESVGGIENIVNDKDDKDEKELIKASQEINRSNRKLIKQTFNSNVLEIEAAGGSPLDSTEKSEPKSSENDDDDWDAL